MHKRCYKYFLSTEAGVLPKKNSPGESIITFNAIGLVAEDDRTLCMDTEDWDKNTADRKKIIDDFVFQGDVDRCVSFWSLNPALDGLVFCDLVYSSAPYYFPSHCNSIHQLRSSVSITDHVRDAQVMIDSLCPEHTTVGNALVAREVFYYLTSLEDMDLRSIPIL
jgi:hypothetical protein